MIVTTIMGGLGNQLFQYAAGRALALRTGRRLVLDATLMPTPAGEGSRRLLLPSLPIPRGTTLLRRPGRGGHDRMPSRTVLRAQHRMRQALGDRMVREPEDHDALVDLSDPPTPVAVLYGYWQSHRYHVGAERALRSDLTPPISHDDRVARLLDDLADHELIVVHVRRGDYITDERVGTEFGVLGATHYERAAEIVAARCDRPGFVVLSDDPEWAEDHLRFDARTVHAEVGSPLTATEVLALMARSRHAIIANSSLSWWGARLAAHDDQMVVAPAVWYAGRAVDLDHRLPATWIRLG